MEAETVFAIPDFKSTTLALVIQIGSAGVDVRNVVIFFSDVSEIDWEGIKEMSKNPLKPMLTTSILPVTSSPWMYRCCDYTVGALLGFVEVLTGKKFTPMPNPVDRDFTVRYFQLM